MYSIRASGIRVCVQLRNLLNENLPEIIKNTNKKHKMQ